MLTHFFFHVRIQGGKNNNNKKVAENFPLLLLQLFSEEKNHVLVGMAFLKHPAFFHSPYKHPVSHSGR